MGNNLQRGGQGWGAKCRMSRYAETNAGQKADTTPWLEGINGGNSVPEPNEVGAELGSLGSSHISGKSSPWQI